MPEAAVPRGNVLGFDFGMRRIGVAVGQAAIRSASSLAVVERRNAVDWSVLDKLVREWRPERFVVGLPLDRDGEETDMSRAARRFGAELESRYGQRCDFLDERLSSHAAGERFVAGRAAGALRRKHARSLDAVAAQIILENWLKSLPANTT